MDLCADGNVLVSERNRKTAAEFIVYGAVTVSSAGAAAPSSSSKKLL